MSKLQELKQKYTLGDGAKYEPKPDCKFCNGTGEKPSNRFCICLYVAPEFSDFAGESLAKTAKDILKGFTK